MKTRCFTVESKPVKSQIICMDAVIERIRRPGARYTSALLVKEIKLYSASNVSHCLKRLRNAGMIGADWDSRKASFVYYNIKL
jgi:hypothetical protein